MVGERGRDVYRGLLVVDVGGGFVFVEFEDVEVKLDEGRKEIVRYWIRFRRVKSFLYS